LSTEGQLQSRGIYIDEVYDLAGALSSDYSTYVGDSTNVDRLEKVPFAEVNLTLLSLWSSADTSKVTVSNEDIEEISDPDNNYYGTYSRGKLDAVAASPSPGTQVTSAMHPNNQGITNMVVNPSPPASLSDNVSVIVEASATPTVTVSGSLSSSGLPGGTKFTVSGCSDTVNSQGDFSCTIASGDDVNIIVTAYKKNTICDPAGGGSYSATNVTSDLTGIVINVTCPL
jgi:hypothetical protein